MNGNCFNDTRVIFFSMGIALGNSMILYETMSRKKIKIYVKNTKNMMKNKINDIAYYSRQFDAILCTINIYS